MGGYVLNRHPRSREELLTISARLSRHAWWLYLALMAPIAAAYLAGPLNYGPVFNVIGFSAVAMIVIGVRVHRPAARLAWYLIAAGQACFVAGDVLSYNYPSFFGTALPFPSVADAVYLGGVYPLTIAGLLLLIRRRNPGRDWMSLVDALIVTIGVALLSWVILIAPYTHDTAINLGTKLVSIGYPLGDILMLGVAIRMAVGAGRRSRAYYMMIGALVAVFVTDSIYGWIQLHGVYRPGDPLDGGWILYYVLLGAAALHPSMRSVSDSTATKVKLTRPRILAISVAALIAPILEMLKSTARGDSDAIVIGAGAILLFGLVVMRMIALARTQEATAEREGVLQATVLRTEGEVRLAALVQHSSDVILVLTSTGFVDYASPSVRQVLGYEVGALAGRQLVDYVPEDDQEVVRGRPARAAGAHSGAHGDVPVSDPPPRRSPAAR